MGLYVALGDRQPHSQERSDLVLSHPEIKPNPAQLVAPDVVLDPASITTGRCSSRRFASPSRSTAGVH